MEFHLCLEQNQVYHNSTYYLKTLLTSSETDLTTFKKGSSPLGFQVSPRNTHHLIRGYSRLLATCNLTSYWIREVIKRLDKQISSELLGTAANRD